MDQNIICLVNTLVKTSVPNISEICSVTLEMKYADGRQTLFLHYAKQNLTTDTASNVHV